MEANRHRPGTAGTRLPRERAVSDGDGTGEVQPEGVFRPPARPSTQRSGRSPRTESLVTRGRRRSSDGGRENAAGEKDQMEVATLRQRLAENDLAKAQAQVLSQRHEAEMAKLERYVSQLVDDRGGVDTGTMENIVKDLERSALVKKTQKQVSDLKFDLKRKEHQIASLKAMQASQYVLKLAEEKEALAVRVERLIARPGRDGGNEGQNRSESISEEVLAELERLRSQNSAMRAESARLRAELDLASFHDSTPMDPSHRDSSAIHRGENARTSPSERSSGMDGPLFYEGQAVTCRLANSGSWCPAIIDSARLTIETLGNRGAKRSYLYTARFEEGRSETNIPEHRIRAAGGSTERGAGSTRVANRDGEPVIQSRVFRPGDSVLARDSGRSKGKWSYAEVVRRNSNGSYAVEFEGKKEEHDLHPTMLRCLDEPDRQAPVDRGDTNERDHGASSHATNKPTSTTALSAAEEIELRYEEKRQSLLSLAREAIPDPLEVGQEVLARYPGSSSWSPGNVTAADNHHLRLTVDFESGDFEENLACIFVRPKRACNSSSPLTVSNTHPGDALLAQKQDHSDWCTARFKAHDEREGYCYVVFAGEEKTTRIRTSKARLLYPMAQGQRSLEIPGSPPPPTKPVRAKKHHEGDIVLACIPTLKAWTPALITGAKGRGRYSIEWADGVKADSLLFMNIASLANTGRKSGFALTGRHSISNDLGADQAGARCDGRHALDNDDATRRANSGKFVGNGGSGGGGANEAAKAAEAHVRLRQRQLQVGEPVLAKMLDKNVWAPGSITASLGNGKYDVQFTDGATAEDLSFLFIRGLDQLESSDGGYKTEEADRSSHDNYRVDDKVYVLRRGLSPAEASAEKYNREMWRAGTVISSVNGRLTVKYEGEEGAPQESRIDSSRVRPRHTVRQKSAMKGDVVLAQSKIPGRGWMMGAITARSGNGEYTIAFSDGSEEEGIRFVNFRHVESSPDDDDKRQKTEKPAMRAIRQRRFRVDELALARNPDTCKWGVAKVLEAFPSGRYDLQFLGNGDAIVMGVSFKSMRHLNLSQVASDNPVLAGGNDRLECGSQEDNTDDSPNLTRNKSDESWDEHHDHCNNNSADNNERRGVSSGISAPAVRSSGDQEHSALKEGDRVMVQEDDSQAWCEGTISACRSRGRYDVLLGDDSVQHGVPPSRIRRAHPLVKDAPFSDGGIWNVGSEVCVLRRGKRETSDLEDTDTWRPGWIVSIRGNGTFAVEYDESGAPKEDRVASSRLRRRPRGGGRGGRGRSLDNEKDAQDEDLETFKEGDVVLAAMEGSSGVNRRMVVVEEDLGDRVFCVAFLDGSGKEELESHHLSHIKHASQAESRSASVGRGLTPGQALGINKRAVKKRKLHPGEIVLAKMPDTDGDDRRWFAATVNQAVGNGMYSVLFEGDDTHKRVHFTKVRPLKNVVGSEEENPDKACSPGSSTFELLSEDRDKRGGGDSNAASTAGSSSFLHVAEVSFNLSMAASAARRTSPRLVLATGEQGDVRDAAPWLHGDADGHGRSCSPDGANVFVRGDSRGGTRNPSWTDKDDKAFWLSLRGLGNPALYVALEDSRSPFSTNGREGRFVSEDAIMAEVCIPVPVGSDTPTQGNTVEVELENGAGTVSLQWSTHADTSGARR